MALRTGSTKQALNRLMESSRRTGLPRYLSDGRILSEEERAAENVYIQKMERERLAKLKAKAEKEKVAAAAAAEKDKSHKVLSF
ncbi:hypothetical protein ACHQM5_013828 [Ranunculus cassubicifolius]